MMHLLGDSVDAIGVRGSVNHDSDADEYLVAREVGHLAVPFEELVEAASTYLVAGRRRVAPVMDGQYVVVPTSTVCRWPDGHCEDGSVDHAGLMVTDKRRRYDLFLRNCSICH